LVVPECLRVPILREYHDKPFGGHLSFDKLWPTLKSRFYWPCMRSFIEEYIQKCDLCMRYKSRAQPSHGLLNPIKVSRPFQLVGVDIVVMRTSSNNYRYILVTIDYFINWVKAEPMKNQNMEECIKAFFKSVVSRHGCPEEMMSDSGTQFLGGSFQQFCKNFNIKQRESSPYLHQANGKVEKFIGFLKAALALLTPLDKKERWDEMIDHCLFAYRTSYNRMINDRPFYMLYGRDALLPQDAALPIHDDSLRKIKADAIEGYQKKLTDRLKDAYAKLINHKYGEQYKYKNYYDNKHKQVNYEIGAKVLVLYDAPSRGPLMPRWLGPYTIIQKIDSVIYRVENENRITTAHVNRLTPYHT
jgi:hypothetical protein